jgi:dTDP-4-amino-4,6-dideoxygalactose transaminase
MAALHLAYLHFGIGVGDEVIVPAQTHTATVHAVEWVGARPVFVDCDPRTGNVTAEAIARAVTPRTRAISVVHFVGIPCDMEPILAVARQQGLKVIEDCEIALGTRYRGTHVGLLGDAGCFSFYPVKHMTTGEGGMFVTRHADVHAGVSRLRAFGVDRSHAERTLPGMYDVPTLGLNYRMSEMQAALGRSQLRRMSEALRQRRENFATLKAALAHLPAVRVLDARRPEAVNSHYCLVMVLAGGGTEARNRLAMMLSERGVGTSIYYPQPVPRMRYYQEKYGYDAAAYPHATQISDCSIALPVGPHLTAADVGYICDVVAHAIQEQEA